MKKNKIEKEIAKIVKDLDRLFEVVKGDLSPEDKLRKELVKIAKWNEETFPEATLGGQLAKLEEEFVEFVGAKTPEEEIKELADVAIVCGGLMRWNSFIGDIVIDNIVKIERESLPAILRAVKDKMEINRKRNWHKTGEGKYHH